jgi:hypothetical protein
MAKGARRRLKVFQAQIGFYDTVVATPSQAAALRAWGVRQDLFAAGQARIADDAQAIDAALAHPDTPLRRARRSARHSGCPEDAAQGADQSQAQGAPETRR